MEIHQLKMFIYVATELSYRRAAEKLHMTQPPLTRQIQQLEHSLGTLLFKRSTRKVELTEAGKVLFNEADKIITLADSVASQVRLRAQGCSGELSIGIFSWGVISYLPEYLRILKELKPNVKVTLKNLSKEKQVEAIRRGELDIGFCRFAVHQNDIHIGEIEEEKYLIAINTNDSLCLKDSLSLSDLDDKPIILYPASSLTGMAQHICTAFAEANINLNVANYCEDIMTSLLLVSAGYGVCITTQWAENISMPNVVYRPLTGKNLKRQCLNYMFKETSENILVKDFIRIIKGSLTENDHIALTK